MHAGLSLAREDADRLTDSYRPPRSPGIAVGAALLASVLGVALFLSWQMAWQPVGPMLFARGFGLVVLLVIAGLLGYWIYGCLTLEYAVGPDRLVVRWAGERHVIAAGQIERLVSGESVAIRRLDGPDWPGYHVGPTVLPGLGPTLVFSTHRHPAEVTFVVTPTVTYALAVGQAWVERALGRVESRGGPVEDPAAEPGAAAEQSGPDGDGLITPAAALVDAPVVVRRWWLLDLGLWSDNLALALLGLGVTLNLLLFNFVLSAYPSLPPFLPVHFASSGAVDRIGVRDEILRLPLMALAVWLTNLGLAAMVHRRERLAAVLLLGASAGVQIMFLVAAAKIVG